MQTKVLLEEASIEPIALPPTIAATPTTMDDYTRPSENEKAHYYDGLHVQPRLLARTSTEPWDHDAQLEKCLLEPPRSHLAQRLWMARNQALRMALDECLHGLPYYCMELWRVGYRHDFAPSRNAPPVLMVSVHEDETTWQDAMRAALACKRVLESFAIFDVHCEIREPVAVVSD